MKKLTVIALAVTVLLMSGSAMAYERKVWDDLSWWGNSGATPDPVPDKFGRSGYWWWPTDAASNVNDSEAWGNRGVVYYAGWQPIQPAIETPEPPPTPPVKPAEATWTKPVLNHVLFDFDKSVLKPEGQAATNQVVQHMNEWPGTVVTIEGHTCSVGTDAYNMGLGQRRADSVKKYMLDAGISPSRVNTVSFGESQPAVPNDTPANRKLNRRAVFDVTLGN